MTFKDGCRRMLQGWGESSSERVRVGGEDGWESVCGRREWCGKRGLLYVELERESFCSCLMSFKNESDG
jgi:hypothetical protein